jgi:membrane protease YdiL (CAAX protease family)
VVHTSGRRQRAILHEAICVGALVLHNVAINKAIPAPADAAMNMISAAGATLAARRAGYAWQELGLHPNELRRGIVLGSSAGGALASLVAGAARLPAVRDFFYDERVVKPGPHEVLYQAVFRVPIATALAEEVLFRGVMHAILARHRAIVSTQRWTSVLFGVWHVLPTLQTFDGSYARRLVPGRGGPLGAVLIAVAATAAAGGFFSSLRTRANSVVAPAIAHAAISVAAYATGRSVVQRTADLLEDNKASSGDQAST